MARLRGGASRWIPPQDGLGARLRQECAATAAWSRLGGSGVALDASRPDAFWFRRKPPAGRDGAAARRCEPVDPTPGWIGSALASGMRGHCGVVAARRLGRGTGRVPSRRVPVSTQAAGRACVHGACGRAPAEARMKACQAVVARWLSASRAPATPTAHSHGAFSSSGVNGSGAMACTPPRAAMARRARRGRRPWVAADASIRGLAAASAAS